MPHFLNVSIILPEKLSSSFDLWEWFRILFLADCDFVDNCWLLVADLGVVNDEPLGLFLAVDGVLLLGSDFECFESSDLGVVKEPLGPGVLAAKGERAAGVFLDFWRIAYSGDCCTIRQHRRRNLSLVWQHRIFNLCLVWQHWSRNPWSWSWRVWRNVFFLSGQFRFRGDDDIGWLNRFFTYSRKIRD